jgi:hypothetical protein
MADRCHDNHEPIFLGDLSRKDLHRGLVKGDSILIAIYDEKDDRLVWYQLGMTDEDVVAAFDEWRDAQ